MASFRLMPVRQPIRQAFAPLLVAADAEGLQVLRCLLDEWLSGVNRFDRPGESLWRLQDAENRWVTVGGLNMEPAPGRPDTARMRRSYVLSGQRGQGCGRPLLGAVLASAAGRFNRLRANAQAARATAF